MAPGRRICIFLFKFTTVDSNPILHFPPSKINESFLPNSSKTSLEHTGLTADDKFALGIAKGNFKLPNNFLIILF